jgi:hypothetical protein
MYCSLITQSPVKGQADLFKYLAILKKAALHNCLLISAHKFSRQVSKYIEAQLLEHRLLPYFTLKMSPLSSKMAILTIDKISNCSTSFTTIHNAFLKYKILELRI